MTPAYPPRPANTVVSRCLQTRYQGPFRNPAISCSPASSASAKYCNTPPSIPDHRRPPPAGLNRRLSTFSATGSGCLLSVVALYLRFGFTRKFDAVIRQRLRSTPITKPSSRSLHAKVRAAQLTSRSTSWTFPNYSSSVIVATPIFVYLLLLFLPAFQRPFLAPYV